MRIWITSWISRLVVTIRIPRLRFIHHLHHRPVVKLQGAGKLGISLLVSEFVDWNLEVKTSWTVRAPQQSTDSHSAHWQSQGWLSNATVERFWLHCPRMNGIETQLLKLVSSLWTQERLLQRRKMYSMRLLAATWCRHCRICVWQLKISVPIIKCTNFAPRHQKRTEAVFVSSSEELEGDQVVYYQSPVCTRTNNYCSKPKSSLEKGHPRHWRHDICKGLEGVTLYHTSNWYWLEIQLHKGSRRTSTESIFQPVTNSLPQREAELESENEMKELQWSLWLPSSWVTVWPIWSIVLLCS
jgi:hypothetical protein